MRQGPHQAAQKSTSTGTLLAWTISSNSAGPTAMGSAMGGNGDLQAPHLPVSAMCLAGIRFGFPQDGQLLTIGITNSSLSKMRQRAFSSLSDQFQCAAEEAVELGGEGLFLGNGLLDGFFGSRTLVAKIDECGEYVVHGRALYGGRHRCHGKVIQLVF